MTHSAALLTPPTPVGSRTEAGEFRTAEGNVIRTWIMHTGHWADRAIFATISNVTIERLESICEEFNAMTPGYRMLLASDSELRGKLGEIRADVVVFKYAPRRTQSFFTISQAVSVYSVVPAIVTLRSIFDGYTINVKPGTVTVRPTGNNGPTVAFVTCSWDVSPETFALIAQYFNTKCADVHCMTIPGRSGNSRIAVITRGSANRATLRGSINELNDIGDAIEDAVMLV